jgi:hypothetical protein
MLFIVIALGFVIASYSYCSVLIGNVCAFYSYGPDYMTKAITCNVVMF